MMASHSITSAQTSLHLQPRVVARRSCQGRGSFPASGCRTSRLVVLAAGFGKKGPPKGKPLSKSAEKRNELGSKFDEMAADGKPIYAVFVRAAGPNQWFPVGPMTVDNEASIVPGIFGAEKDLVEASLRMYPALISKRKDPGLEYGYRLRDAPQMSEAEIKAGGNPFDNVVVATRAPGTEQPEVSAGGGFFDGIKDAMSNFERNFTSGR